MDRAEIDAIIRKALVCRLGLYDGSRPYVVPLSFGYDGRSFYFHGSAKGTKVGILSRHPVVCFELDCDVALAPAAELCRCGLKFRSVVGFGRAAFITDPGEKRRALSAIMSQYTEGEYEFPDRAVDGVTVFRVDIESITGRQKGY